MTGDVARRQPEDRSADAWALPEVIGLEIRHARYQEPLQRYVTAREVAEHREAVEFHVTTAAEFPVRAYAPVLYVGDVVVNDYEQLARDRYVFRAFDAESLSPGAPIALGWPRQPERRRETAFRYDPPPEPRKR